MTCGAECMASVTLAAREVGQSGTGGLISTEDKSSAWVSQCCVSQ